MPSIRISQELTTEDYPHTKDEFTYIQTRSQAVCENTGRLHMVIRQFESDIVLLNQWSYEGAKSSGSAVATRLNGFPLKNCGNDEQNNHLRMSSSGSTRGSSAFST